MQYTKQEDESTDDIADEWMDEDMVFIRKFKSVKDFMSKVNSLDTVLENIESFSLEPKTPTSQHKELLLPMTPEPGSPASALQFLSEEKKGSEMSDAVPMIEEARNKKDSAVIEVNWTPGLTKGAPSPSELNLCCICLERQIESVLTCFHAYCRPCIDDWKSRDPTCPLCRELENGRGSFMLLKGPDRA